MFKSTLDSGVTYYEDNLYVHNTVKMYSVWISVAEKTLMMD
jgi:hypothetical protein